MKSLCEFYRLAHLVSQSGVGVLSYVPRRGVQYYEPLKWVIPERKTHYDPIRSGDKAAFPKIDPSSLAPMYKESQELNTANNVVKKIFSIGSQRGIFTLQFYEEELVKKVRQHPYDESSLECIIAKLTARIRYFSKIISKNPPKLFKLRITTAELIAIRRKLLGVLRQKDYKRFEWLLETLDLEFKPVPVPQVKVTRKRSLTLLAKLRVEQAKEKKLAALRKSYDEQKVPFLEDKIKKLKDIKAKEEKYNLPVTVTDADIEGCIQRLEEVKIKVAERAQRPYERKVHPFFLEVYDEKLLWEKEKAGEKIREEMFNYQKNTNQDIN